MYRSLGWKNQRKSTIWSKILIKNYKKVPWIKGRDHVTRPIRQGNNPNFEVLFLFLFSVSFFLLFYLSFFQNYPNHTLCSTQNQEWERERDISFCAQFHGRFLKLLLFSSACDKIHNRKCNDRFQRKRKDKREETFFNKSFNFVVVDLLSFCSNINIVLFHQQRNQQQQQQEPFI